MSEYKNPDLLEELYWGKGLNQTEIANRLGCNPGSVSYHMRKNGIKTRSGSEANIGRKINVSEYQQKLLTGILMSDGWVSRDSKRPAVAVGMTNEEFINWLKNELEDITTKVREKETKNKNIYRLRTYHHEQFKKFEDWYSSGKKVWPDDIYLYPETLKMLFVGDGTVAKPKYGKEYIKICMKNEHKNKEKIKKLFNKIGFNPKWNNYSIRFTVGESDKIWEYMGSPPPGFEYKCPDRRDNRQS